VPDGPLTSRLQHLKEGDEIIVQPQGDRHAGHPDNLENGPSLSDRHRHRPCAVPERDSRTGTYERFEKVVLLHGCRRVAELAYGEMITETPAAG